MVLVFWNQDRGGYSEVHKTLVKPGDILCICCF